MKQARCAQPAMRTNSDELFELSTQQMSNVCGGANPRPYNGPTEIVAQGEGGTCPNGLAPNPWRRPGCG